MEVTHAKNTINNFKRLIGRRFHDSYVQQEKQLNAYSVIEGPNGSINLEVRLRSPQFKIIEIRNLG